MLKTALLAALCLLLPACGPIPPSGNCLPEPDDGRPLCPQDGGGPDCACWYCSGGTNGQWLWLEDRCSDYGPGYACVDHSCVQADPYDDECDAALEEADGVWCEPGQTCGPCVHNPSSDSRHCELLPACSTPSPDECMAESALVSVPCDGPKLLNVVRDATRAVGDRTGQPFQETLKLVAAEITRQTGRCAIGGQEAVFIDRWDGTVEENHTCYSGDGSYIGGGAGKFMRCHVHTKCPAPDPTDYPGEFVLKCGLGNGTVCDRTYRVVSREYCEATGQPRDRCPVRLDGNFAKEACEDYAVGEGQWWCNGAPIGHLENPARARCTGRVKTCTDDGQVCAETDTP